ncbi:hypothetical protein FBU30_008743 [Linnemannia zychae]|nr:hypothetical protein FBU30_008743 [Linnemannia zychae]
MTDNMDITSTQNTNPMADTIMSTSKQSSLIDMPEEVLIQIGLALSCREFGRFIQTNKAIHTCLDSQYVWHVRFTTRFGQRILEEKLDSSRSKDSSRMSPPLTPPSPRISSGINGTFHSSSNNSNNNSANSSPSLQYNNHLDPVSASASPLPSAASSPVLAPSVLHTPPSDSNDGNQEDNDDHNRGEGSSTKNAKGAPKCKPRRIDLRKTNMASKEMLIDMYRQLSRMTLPAEDMMIAHMGNQFWRMISSSESKYGKLAELASVWWMDVVAVFFGVLPGRYKVQWRVKVTSDGPVVNTEFRAVQFTKEEDYHTAGGKPNALSFKPTSKQEFIEQTDTQGSRVNKRPFRNLFRGFTILELPGELVIEDDYQGVFLQIRNHEDWKSGLYIDYVRLVNVDDPEQSQESLAYGLHAQRTATRNEPVNDEGEEYYPSSSAGPVPWLNQKVFGINPDMQIDPRPPFRSHAVRHYNPVLPSAQLDVGARSTLPAVPNSTSTPATQNQNEHDDNNRPAEQPDACLAL